ncbi:Peroxidase 4 [Triticum urartu]|uniref:Peroxidase n=1 Tax=Triticum urartu TaxID=4572 RepID=M7ZGP5_TRIUA|nr:Peroxidase 4 [Triticum urartu]
MAATAVRCLLMAAAVLAPLFAGSEGAYLTPKFYDRRCPGLPGIVRAAMTQAVAAEPRMGASILRLFFHDCFVNGCDASILLDDTANFTGEKNAGPNANSVRGYDVIDTIKAQVDAACKATLQGHRLLRRHRRPRRTGQRQPARRADVDVRGGRRDARNASQSAANSNLPSPASSLAGLITTFGNKGLTPRDMTALSGAHSLGQARCATFRDRIYNDTTIDPKFAALRKLTCPQTGGDAALAPIDVSTPTWFDTTYYDNLVNKQGLFHSDQELYNGGSQDIMVKVYMRNPDTFAMDFGKAMVKMGSLMPSADTPTEIRLDCKKIN